MSSTDQFAKLVSIVEKGNIPGPTRLQIIHEINKLREAQSQTGGAAYFVPSAPGSQNERYCYVNCTKCNKHVCKKHSPTEARADGATAFCFKCTAYGGRSCKGCPAIFCKECVGVAFEENDFCTECDIWLADIALGERKPTETIARKKKRNVNELK